MKSFKRFIASLLTVVLLLSSAPISGFTGLEFSNIFDISASAETYGGTCGENLMWNLDTKTGELEINGLGEMYRWISFQDIPWYNLRKHIKTITIYDGVSSIGADAFWDCDSLTNITIPNSVTEIKNDAFSSCDSLMSITIPCGVTSISSLAFGGCDSLVKITVDENNLVTIRQFIKLLGMEILAIFDTLWIHGDESRLEKIAEIKLGEQFRYCKSLKKQ